MYNSDMDPAHEVAYRATTYVAEGIRIRIDSLHPDLDALLARHGATSWIFISAWNPASQQLPRAENDRRHEELRTVLLETSLPHFPGQGVPDHPGWTPEDSFLALNLDLPHSSVVGRRFGQNAIVWGRSKGPATLVDLTQAS